MARYYRAYQLTNGKFAVALYDESRNMHYRKMTAEESRLTGAHTYCAKDPNDLGGTYTEYETYRQAQNVAKQKNLDNGIEI